MSKILVTGGAGFIGSSLASELANDLQNQVVIVDNFLTGSEENIPTAPNCTFIQGDVNDITCMEPIMHRDQFDYVFHYAAVVGVKRTLDNPLMVLQDIDGLKNIFNLSAQTGVKRLFFASSSEVYGEPVELPQNEVTTPLNSRLPYSVVKNLGEAFCKTYQKEYGLNYTIFRFFNTYSPKQKTDFVIPKFMKAALADMDITIYGDGSQSRTFCHVDDNILATTEALNRNMFINEVVNIGNDVSVSVKDLALTIIELTGSKSTIKYLPPLKEGDMTRRQPDITNMKMLLRRDPVALEEGLGSFIKRNRLVRVAV